MPLLFLTLMLALAAPTLLPAQERRIDVKGDALVEVQPDFAIIRLSLQSRDRLLKRARVMHAADLQAVLAISARYQIAPADVSQDFPEVEDNASGFLVTRAVEITLRDLVNYDALVFDLYDAASLQIEQVEFSVKDLLKYREQAREIGVRAAETKANLIVQTMKRRLGRVIQVSVESGGGYLRRRKGGNGEGSTRSFSQNAISMAPSRSGSRGGLVKVPVTAVVDLTYEILE